MGTEVKVQVQVIPTSQPRTSSPGSASDPEWCVALTGNGEIRYVAIKCSKKFNYVALHMITNNFECSTFLLDVSLMSKLALSV